jgi:SAM-dependent methyltransferase
MHDNFKAQLEAAYDADARRRGGSDREDWKLQLREKFAKFAKAEHKKTVLEIGAADGYDSVYFQAQGFDVLATDLSSKMVELCRERGVKAQAADVYNLEGIRRSFDAIYSMNVLLHVPSRDLEPVLRNINDVLDNNGIFFLGMYGGIEREEVTADPNMMNMPRFFSFVSDETLKKAASLVFDVVSFDIIRPQIFDVGGKDPQFHFQALLLRKKHA